MTGGLTVRRRHNAYKRIFAEAADPSGNSAARASSKRIVFHVMAASWRAIAEHGIRNVAEEIFGTIWRAFRAPEALLTAPPIRNLPDAAAKEKRV